MTIAMEHTTHAIILGVGHCKRGNDWDLPLAGAHAAAFAMWLCSRKMNVPPENIHIFLSRTDLDKYKTQLIQKGIFPRHANRADFKEVLEETLYFEKGSLLYFFGSGHGLLDGKEHQVLFLEDWDREFHDRSIDMSHLLRLLKATPYGANFPNQIAYLDACSRYAQRVSGISPMTGIDPSDVGPAVPGVTQSIFYAANRGELAEAGQFGGRLLTVLKNAGVAGPPEPQYVHEQVMLNWTVQGQNPLYVFHADGKGDESWYQVPNAKGIYAGANLTLEPEIHHTLELSQGFVGRSDERQTLSKWLWTGSQNVCVLQGLPGMGTTSLAWVWLHEDVLGISITGTNKLRVKAGPASNQPLEGVFWWSIKEDPDFRNCLRRALSYLSRTKLDQRMPDADLVEKLLEVFRAKKFLVILDGFEQLLTTETPQEATKLELGAGVSRGLDTETVLAARFLRKISSNVMLSRLLLGSYLVPAELVGKALVSMQRVEGLKKDDAIELLRSQEIPASPTELGKLAKYCEYHPLLLRTAAKIWEVDGEVVLRALSEGDVMAATVSAKFGSLYSRLGQDERAFLTCCSLAFGSTSIDLSNKITGLTRSKCKELLARFKGMGLIIDRGPLGFDSHPLLRAFILGTETPDRIQSFHERFLEHLADPTAGSYPHYISEGETVATQRLFLHRVGAGQFDEAFALFYKFLDPLQSKFGAYDTCARLLQRLFDPPPTRCCLSNKADQIWALNVLAASYSFGGRPREAIEAWEVVQEQADAARDRVMAFINAGIAQTSRGRLKTAENSFRAALSVARKSGDEHWEGVASRELSVSLAAQGESDKALRLVPKPKDGDPDAALAHGSRARIYMMQGNWLKAIESAQLAEEHARELPLMWNQAFWLDSLVAEIATWCEDGVGYPNRDVIPLLEAARRTHWLEREASLLLALANNVLTLGRPTEAKELVEESIFLSNRSEFRLRHVDALVLLARVEKAIGNMSEAKRLADSVFELATSDDGSTYAPGIERAKALVS
jgi:tetratricopeptide (TPR) repeat protein